MKQIQYKPKIKQIKAQLDPSVNKASRIYKSSKINIEAKIISKSTKTVNYILFEDAEIEKWSSSRFERATLKNQATETRIKFQKF